MEIMNNIEFGLSKTEALLSTAAVIPIAGTLPAAVKVALGAIQTVVATTCLLVSVLPAVITQNATWLNRPLEHIVAGIANIVAGIIEGIPLVGTIAYLGRAGSQADKKRALLFASDGNNFNTPYASQFKVEICGKNGPLVQNANTIFEERIANKTYTHIQKLWIAREVVKKILSEQEKRRNEALESAATTTMLSTMERLSTYISPSSVQEPGKHMLQANPLSSS